MAQGKKTGGRVKGTPNRVTADVKAAITQVLEGNASQVDQWLRSVAEGEKEYRFDEEGNPVLGSDGEQLFDWLRRPEPGKALDLWMGLAEFNLPKLSRQTVDGTLQVTASLVIRD